jgi:phosphatidate phosphatase APP1
MRLYTKSLYYSIAAIMIVAMLAAVADAQTDQGRVRGSVRDSSNAFVPGVTVMATNERTGDIRTTVTNEQGYFLIDALKPSAYTVTAELSGFSKIELKALKLAVGQELRSGSGQRRGSARGL